ncbi:MAG TPA: hypothetical protein VFK69_07435 [Candidatus Eisenbacteria bacterium]|nr:hypothetical protein [Candidatus Eisenbacteria bacterium]
MIDRQKLAEFVLEQAGANSPTELIAFVQGHWAEVTGASFDSTSDLNWLLLIGVAVDGMQGYANVPTLKSAYGRVMANVLDADVVSAIARHVAVQPGAGGPGAGSADRKRPATRAAGKRKRPGTR